MALRMVEPMASRTVESMASRTSDGLEDGRAMALKPMASKMMIALQTTVEPMVWRLDQPMAPKKVLLRKVEPMASGGWPSRWPRR
jgi:hypothetical protein